MKESFVEKAFREEALTMIKVINAILDDYARQGYDLSLRQLFYQLVSKNLIPNSERSYKNIGNLVSDARLAGLIDWDMIRDRGREMQENPHWETPAEFLKAAAPQFRVDLWADQPCYVEVMVEKQALEGVLQPVCRRLDIPFTANKGYSSSSAMYEASKRYLQRALEGKALYVIYLGDHDPSGIDMSRDVGDRFNLFLQTALNTSGGVVDLLQFQVQRVALNIEQVEALKPPENPAKITDSRAASYIRRFGESSWELDAIEPRQLADLVMLNVHSLMDVPLFHKNEQLQARGREELLKFSENYRGEHQ